MIRSVGVTNPVIPRRESGGRGAREEPEAPPAQEERPRANSASDDTAKDHDREPPEPPYHIDEYA